MMFLLEMFDAGVNGEIDEALQRRWRHAVLKT